MKFIGLRYRKIFAISSGIIGSHLHKNLSSHPSTRAIYWLGRICWWVLGKRLSKCLTFRTGLCIRKPSFLPLLWMSRVSLRTRTVEPDRMHMTCYLRSLIRESWRNEFFTFPVPLPFCSSLTKICQKKSSSFLSNSSHHRWLSCQYFQSRLCHPTQRWPGLRHFHSEASIHRKVVRECKVRLWRDWL